MPGIVTNQISNSAVTSAKIATLTSVLVYDGALTPSSITDDQHLTHKAYVDSVAQGLDVKDACNVATTTNLFADASGTGTGKTLTNNDPDQPAITIDGVALSLNDRVLVKNYGGEIFSVQDFPAETGGGTSSNYAFADTGDFGKYWEFTTSAGVEYYVWYNVNSALSDPIGAATGANQPFLGAGSPIGVEVAVANSATAPTIAASTQTALDLLTTVVDATLNPTAAPGTDSIYVALQGEGNTTDAEDGNASGAMPGLMTFAVEVTGTGTNGSGSPSNGIYTVTTVGGSSVDWVLTRAIDADDDAEVTQGLFTLVTEGTDNSSAGFVLTSADPITVDTTNQQYTQFSGAGAIVAGDGLAKSGNTLSVNVDDSTIEINADTLRIKDSGITNAKLADDTIAPGKLNDGWDATYSSVFNGFFVVDSPTSLSYNSATKPVFSASVGVNTVVQNGAGWTHGETFYENSVDTAGDDRAVFMGFDNPTTPTIIYYLPLDGVALTNTNTITSNDTASTAVVDTGVSAINTTGSPDGTTTTFSLSSSSTAGTPVDSSAMAWRNGVLQKRVQTATALESGPDTYFFDSASDDIEFGLAPARGEEIIVRYISS